MASSINASTSGAGGVITTADNTGILNIQTAGTTAVTVDASQNVLIGATSASGFDSGADNLIVGNGSGSNGLTIYAGTSGVGTINFANGNSGSSIYAGGINYNHSNNRMSFYTTDGTGRMVIDSNGGLWLATGQYTSGPATSSTLTGFYFGNTGEFQVSRNANTSVYINRITDDGGLVSFRQAGTEEGSISVSGTTVSYNGGHLSRWSQWQNETGKPNVYRGTILESTNDMCEWEKDGEPLPNEQATKTIVSTTVASKAVAGVFDRYDEDDKTNPYDFYVAQSGDFVIRIAQGVVVQNGDLLESAGDGTAKPQADDICRSSTIAKVTSNYVSATYEDGSYCVPCILMIG